MDAFAVGLVLLLAMAGHSVGLVLLLAMAGHSDATYCVCDTGASQEALQKNIDYACGAGADCSAILQVGACYRPNTVIDHCNYAVNSYYQMKGQITGSCDFEGTASVTQTAPNAAPGCVYPSSPSNAGSTTPTSPNAGGTPKTGGTNASTVPTGGTNPVTVPGSTISPGGLGPTGSGFSNRDGSDSVTVLPKRSVLILVSVSLTLSISGLMWPGLSKE